MTTSRTSFLNSTTSRPIAVRQVGNDFEMPTAPAFDLAQLLDTANNAAQRNVQVFLSVTPRSVAVEELQGKSLRSIYGELFAGQAVPAGFIVFSSVDGRGEVVSAEHVLHNVNDLAQIKSTDDAAVLA